MNQSTEPIKIPLSLTDIVLSVSDLQEETYNEIFLAALRKTIKDLENEDKKVCLVPQNFMPTVDGSDSELFDYATAAIVHASRRLKDCKNIVGISLDFLQSLALSDNERSQFKTRFIQAFQKKYSHFSFF